MLNLMNIFDTIEYAQFNDYRIVLVYYKTYNIDIAKDKREIKKIFKNYKIKYYNSHMIITI